jgi:quinoprotein glucose dehydrogenase
MRRLVVVGLVAAAVPGLVQIVRSVSTTDEWPTYGNDGGSMQYSPLTDVTRANVQRLRVAWTFPPPVCSQNCVVF